jgi:hypothetical protein
MKSIHAEPDVHRRLAWLAFMFTAEHERIDTPQAGHAISLIELGKLTHPASRKVIVLRGVLKPAFSLLTR